MTSVLDARGSTTQLRYDAVGNLTDVIDPLQGEHHHTHYEFDELNRVTQRTDPLGHSDFYVYDAASRLIQSTDRLGRVNQYSYNNYGDLTHETWAPAPLLTANHQCRPGSNEISSLPFFLALPPVPFIISASGIPRGIRDCD